MSTQTPRVRVKVRRRVPVSSVEEDLDAVFDKCNTEDDKLCSKTLMSSNVLKSSNVTNIIGENEATPTSGKDGRIVIQPAKTENLVEVENDHSRSVKGCPAQELKDETVSVRKLTEFREIHDLTKLDCITLENVLKCLAERYRAQRYYTYAGPVLLSLNSCHRVSRASIVDDVTRMRRYFVGGDDFEQDEGEGHRPPLVYDIGRQSLRNLLTVGSDQIILVSGESGAGKTTATQQLIKYLTENNSRNFGTNICSNLDRKIYYATLILELFGNAKTQANPNSSRFGRLVQLNYDKVCGRITGAEIQTYLLEKHRVAKYDYRCERNFHIFYYILHGLKTGTVSLKSVSWINIKERIPKHLLFQADECEDDELERFLNAIEAFNMTDDLSEILEVLLSLVVLLSISFTPECDSSSEEEYRSGLESPYRTEYTVLDRKAANLSAELLGVNDNELVDILVARKITAGGLHRRSIFRKPCERASECEERLHALLSFVYDRLFSHILDHLNSNLKGFLESASQVSTLALLDLYGFENFNVNHLEQICINYANERLQQINISIVKSYYEQSRSVDEDAIPPMELNRIEMELNQRIGDLHAHIFSFLDEECLLQRSSDNRAVLERMNLATKTNSKFIRTGKLHVADCKFRIAHYATIVEYELNGMVQKNKDHIPPEFQDILKSSSKAFVSSVFKYDTIRSRNISGRSGRTPQSVEKTKYARGKTILTRFKTSVDELMARLSATENKDVHFIRCIRPNADLLAGTFSLDIVEKQLHACGIADVVKIAGNGYPIRIYTSKFMKAFPRAMSYFCSSQINPKLLSIIFSEQKYDDLPSIKFGKTMVFMSENCWKKLKKTENCLIVSAVKCIQRAWRANLDRKEQLRRVLRAKSSSMRMTFGISNESSHIRDSNSLELYTEILDNSLSSGIGLNGSLDASTLSSTRNYSTEKQRPQLYYGSGIASRAPVHTLPIKFYTKKTCLRFVEKQPRRLVANGINDAFEDHGINFYKT